MEILKEGRCEFEVLNAVGGDEVSTLSVDFSNLGVGISSALMDGQTTEKTPSLVRRTYSAIHSFDVHVLPFSSSKSLVLYPWRGD